MTTRTSSATERPDARSRRASASRAARIAGRSSPGRISGIPPSAMTSSRPAAVSRHAPGRAGRASSARMRSSGRSRSRASGPAELDDRPRRRPRPRRGARLGCRRRTRTGSRPAGSPAARSSRARAGRRRWRPAGARDPGLRRPTRHDGSDRGGRDRRQVGGQHDQPRCAVGDRPAGRRSERPGSVRSSACRIGRRPGSAGRAQDRRVGTDHDRRLRARRRLRPPGPTDRAGRGRAPGAPPRRATRRGATSRPRGRGPARSATSRDRSAPGGVGLMLDILDAGTGAPAGRASRSESPGELEHLAQRAERGPHRRS